VSWDEHAATWDQNEAARAYARAAFDTLAAAAERHGLPLAGARICDFGCGTGLLSERLMGRCYGIDAIDSSPAMLAVLRAKIAQHDWSRIRLYPEVPLGEPYDLVVCSSVCAFLDDYAGSVSRLAARLRPGGLFVQWDWEAGPENAMPVGLSRETVRGALTAAGLEAISVETAFSERVGEMEMRPLMGVGRRPA
jgi:2-polyprenyl-3-methyl-5-hydroxy-6-metoxy-1,4-benzoquinol methylase